MNFPTNIGFSARYRLKVTDPKKLALGLASGTAAAVGMGLVTTQSHMQGVPSAVGSVGGQSALGFLRNAVTMVPRDPELEDYICVKDPHNPSLEAENQSAPSPEKESSK